MKGINHSNGFWEGGFSLFQDELAKQEDALLAPLSAALKVAPDAEAKARLKQEIDRIEADFRTRRRNSRYSLFARG